MLKKMMFIRSIFVSFIVLEFPFSLCLPQGCSKCSKGPPQIPMYIRPDNTRYYLQNRQPHSSRHPLRFLQGATNVFHELNDRRSLRDRNGVLSHLKPSRRTRDVSSDNPSLPHDINFKNDMVVPVRVIRHAEDKKKTDNELTQQNSTVAQDKQNTQDNPKNDEREKIIIQKNNQRLPVVPVPRIKTAREQKIVAETLSEEVSIPATGQSPGLAGVELGEVLSGPSTSGTGKNSKFVESPVPRAMQSDIYSESMDKMNAYYPIRRFAEFLQSAQNRVVIVPPGTRIIQAVGPHVNYEDLINYPAYESDYILEDYSGTVAQIESPGALEKNSNSTAVQDQDNSLQNNTSGEKKITSGLQEMPKIDNEITTIKP